MAGYWPSSFLRFNGKTNERTRPIFRHLDQAGLVKKGYLIYETDYALVRIKNDFFTLKAAGKKPNFFVAHETHKANERIRTDERSVNSLNLECDYKDKLFL